MSLLFFYQSLLRIYPDAYRAEFGEEMLEVFGQALAQAGGAGFSAMMRLLAREIPSLLREGLAQRWNTSAPVNRFLAELLRRLPMERQFRYSTAAIIFMVVSLIVVLLAIGRATEIVHTYSIYKGYDLLRPMATTLLIVIAAGLCTGLVRFALGRSGSQRLARVETWQKGA